MIINNLVAVIRQGAHADSTSSSGNSTSSNNECVSSSGILDELIDTLKPRDFSYFSFPPLYDDDVINEAFTVHSEDEDEDDEEDEEDEDEVATVEQQILPIEPPKFPGNPPIPPSKSNKKPWPPNTCLIVGDSTLNGLNESRMSKNKQIVVRSFSGAVVNDFYNYLEPLMEKKPSKLIIHAGTNDTTNKNANEILNDLVQLRDYIKKRFGIDMCISSPTLRCDNYIYKNIVEELSRKLRKQKIPLINHEKVDVDCLENKGKYAGLHLNSKGVGRMAINFIAYNRKN